MGRKRVRRGVVVVVVLSCVCPQAWAQQAAPPSTPVVYPDTFDGEFVTFMPEDDGLRPAPTVRDYDRASQVLWSTVAGVGGSLVFGGTALAITAAACPERDSRCLRGAVPGRVLGWSAGLIAAPVIATEVLGGPDATVATHYAMLGGLVLGTLGSAFLVTLLPAPPDAEDPFAPGVVAAWGGYLALIGAGAGAGAALGYQLFYPWEQEPVVWSPWLDEEGGGVVFGGRF